MLGYSDGSIAIFDLASCKDLSTSSKVHIIYPTETVKTHNAPVKILKWSKSNQNFKLVSGTTNDIQYVLFFFVLKIVLFFYCYKIL